MAKSKSGGTRSYIRGRVGADVYSIGKDSAGKKQQVVRSLAETVANPQTEAQMRGRMIMSTVMQAVSAMKPIIDHSFDNVPSGQPALSEFIRRNYALIKADVAAHPASGNEFGLNMYQEKGVKVGAYVISAGEAVIPDGLVSNTQGSLNVVMTGETPTFADLKAKLAVSGEFYYTICAINADGTFSFARLRLSSQLPDETVLTSDNIASCFDIEGNVSPTMTLSGNVLRAYITLTGAQSVILSQNAGDGWKHSNTVLLVQDPENVEYTADIALPTYPVGEQRFLNGGEF